MTIRDMARNATVALRLSAGIALVAGCSGEEPEAPYFESAVSGCEEDPFDGTRISFVLVRVGHAAGWDNVEEVTAEFRVGLGWDADGIDTRASLAPDTDQIASDEVIRWRGEIVALTCGGDPVLLEAVDRSGQRTTATYSSAGGLVTD